MISNFAPIVVFAYKRSDALKLTIEALKKNHHAIDSDLYIFSDAAKKAEDSIIIESVRTFLKTVDGFKSVTIIESPINKGLAKSVIEGVSKIFETHESVIVIEDDLITTENFLAYMNTALETYAHQNQVFSISGYSFDLADHKKEYQYDGYFLCRASSWGWATWKNRWTPIDWNVSDYDDFKNNRKLQKEFSAGGSDLNAMLRKQMEGKLDSWLIRWTYHQFKVKGITLYPLYSKIDNIGFDEHATHTKGSDNRYKPNLDRTRKYDFNFPTVLKPDPSFQKKFQGKMGIARRIWGKFETLLERLF